MDKEITSLHNPEIKKALQLKEPKHRKKFGLFLVEGEKEILLAQEAGFEIIALYEKEKTSGTKASLNILKKLSYRENPSEKIAVFKEKKFKLENCSYKKGELAIILDQVEKPGNIGAIARSAKACGINLIFLADYNGDIYNPNAIRASRGHLFSLEIISLKSSELLSWLKKKKINIFLAQAGEKESYWQKNLQTGGVVVLGREDRGLSSYWQKEKHQTISLPMKNKVDSLNVSVSAALIAYEYQRQKSL